MNKFEKPASGAVLEAPDQRSFVSDHSHKTMDPLQSSPPPLVIKELLRGPMVANLVYVAAELGIPDLLANGPLSAEELAQQAGAQPGPLHRILRILSLRGVFQHVRNTFSNTPVAELLREDVPGSMRTYVRFQGHPVIQKAFSNLIAGVRDGNIPFDDAVGMNFFQFLESNPELAQLFNSFMAGVTARVSTAVAEAYDFSDARHIVDIGGGAGELLCTILKQNKRATGTIVDIGSLQSQAESRIAVDALKDRCNFKEGDFFKSLPTGADIYLLKSVIHDWDDSRAVEILRNCRKVMNASSVLLLVESVVDPTKPNMDVLMGDIIMLTMSSGRERTLIEFESILTQAGLRIEQVINTTTPATILKVVVA